jgi:hypothetical protein
MQMAASRRELEKPARQGLELGGWLSAKSVDILLISQRFSFWGHRCSIFGRYPQKYPQFHVPGQGSQWTRLDEQTARFEGIYRDFLGFLDVSGRDRTSMELGRLATAFRV